MEGRQKNIEGFRLDTASVKMTLNQAPSHVSGLLMSGEGLEFIEFVERYPSIMLKMVTFGVASAIGQVGTYTAIWVCHIYQLS